MNILINQLGSLQGLIVTFVAIGVVLGLAFFVLSEFSGGISDLRRDKSKTNILINKKKKGQLGSLQGLIITFVVIGVVLGLAFSVLSEFLGGISDPSAKDSVNKTITALAKVPSWLGIIVIVAIVGIILAVLFTSLPRFRGGV